MPVRYTRGWGTVVPAADSPNSMTTGVKPLIVTAVTINPIWRTQKEVKSIFYFICFIVVIIKTLSMEE